MAPADDESDDQAPPNDSLRNVTPEVEKIIDQWKAAIADGQNVKIEDLCVDAPHLADEVRRVIDEWTIQWRAGNAIPAGFDRTVPTEVMTSVDDNSASATSLQQTAIVTATGGDDDTEPATKRDHGGAPLYFEYFKYSGDLRHPGRFKAGGNGQIWKAYDSSLERTVMLKTVKREGLSEDAVREMERELREEAKITAALDHPGIASVYGIGEMPDKQYFFAMRQVAGKPLSEVIREFHDKKHVMTGDKRMLGLRSLVRQFLAICETIGYAHREGYIHRDIKPGNIMVGEFGDTVLLDWGIAKWIGKDQTVAVSDAQGKGTPSPTTSNSNKGTIFFMSPEQARGDREIGRPSDIFSLGATLFNLLTGAYAAGVTREEAFENLKQGTIRSPRSVDSSVDPAIDAICQKALAFEPMDRYAGVERLADDIKAWLADTPVSRDVFQDTAIERFRRWGRHHRQAFRLVSVFVPLLIGVLTLASIGMTRAYQREFAAHAESLGAWAAATADGIASAIDVRWRTLEKMAADPQLHEQLLAAAKQTGPDQEEQQRADRVPLDQWLRDRQDEIEDQGIGYWTLIALDQTGQLRAIRWQDGRDTKPEASDRFRNRSYFHGGNSELSDEEAMQARPLRAPFFSPPYKGKFSRSIQSCSSVPIFRRAGDEVIGVLGLVVPYGRVIDIPMETSDDRCMFVVETRDVAIDGASSRGMVVSYKAKKDKPITEVDQASRLHPDDLVQVMAMIDELNDQGSDGESTRTPVRTIADFHHPVEKTGDWDAVAAPVVVRHRPAKADNGKGESREFGLTGLVVIVCQRSG